MKGFNVKIKDKDVIQAYQTIAKEDNRELIAQVIGVDVSDMPEGWRLLNEYLLVNGLRMVVYQLKELKAKQRQERMQKETVDAITKESLVKALRERGYDEAAEHVEGRSDGKTEERYN